MSDPSRLFGLDRSCGALKLCDVVLSPWVAPGAMYRHDDRPKGAHVLYVNPRDLLAMHIELEDWPTYAAKAAVRERARYDARRRLAGKYVQEDAYRWGLRVFKGAA